MKKILLLTFMGLMYMQAYTQSCVTTSKNPWEWPSHSKWYFGDGNIINFSAGGAITTNSTRLSYEGVSTASSDQGNLLFYTNGRNLWNAAGTLKSSALLEGNEGGGTGPKGSASQGVITVRHPLNPNVYYVFTTDDALGGTLGLNYVTVDNLGNVLSGPTRLGAFRTTEGIAATMHGNGVDIWVTVQQSGSTNFNSFLIRCTGIVTTPVVSAGAINVSGDRERGGLAFSWDGKKFAQGHADYWPNSGAEITLHDFNNMTGVISNARDCSPTGSGENPYDIIFSPDNNRLYISSTDGKLGTLDISSGNSATITASFAWVPGIGPGSHSSLEMGGDGNLYMGSSGAGLRRITGNMNAATGLSRSVSLALSNLGLPTMYLPPQEEPDIQEVGPYCNTDAPVDLSTKWLCSGLDAEDPSGTPASVYTASCGACINAGTGVFSPATAGVGNHRIIFTKCSVDDTIFIQVNSCSCSDTTLSNIAPICVASTIDLATKKVTTAPGTWSIQGAGANWPTLVGNVFTTTATTAAGNYTVRHTLTPDPGGACPKYAERIIKVNGKPIVTLTTTPVCEGSATLTFNGAPTGGVYSGAGVTGATFNPTTPGTTAVTYTYTDANTCTNAVTANQVVNAKPTVTFTTTPVCEGSASLTFNGAPTGGVYSGTGITGATFNPANAGTTAVTYTYTDGNTCSKAVTANQIVNAKPSVTFTTTPVCEGSATLTFNGAPTGGVYSGTGITGATFNPTAAGTKAVTYTYTDGNGCINAAAANQVVNALPVVTFTTTPICEGAAAITFNGSPSSGVYSGAGITSATFNPTTSGTIAVTYTYTDNNSCSNAVTANQVVNAKPAVTFTTSPVCEGSASLTFNGAPTGGIYSGTGITGATFNPTTAGTTAVTYTYADNNSCSSAVTTNQVVNAKPTVTFNTTPVCEGAAAMTFNGAPSGGVYSGTGITGASFNPTIPGTTAVTYTYTDGNGCINAAAANQVVNAKPTISLSPVSICPGSSTTLDAGNGFTSYSWAPNGETTQTLLVNAQGTYTATVTNANGCSASSSSMVSINPNLNIDLGLDKSICIGNTATFTTNYANAGVTYAWSGPGGYTNSTQAITVGIAGTYHVDVADPLGCTGKADVDLVVNPLPIVTFTTTPVCEGSASITFNGAPAGGVYSGTGISGATFNPAAAVTTAVTYTYTDGNGCINSATANQVVNAIPTVTFTTTPVCEGSALLTFNGAPTGGVYSGTGIIGATFNPTAPGTTVVTYTYTDGNNCKNTAAANQVVNAKPTLTFTTTPVCEGAPAITFNATPASGTYSGTGVNGATFNPAIPGTTAVTYTYTDGNNCSNTATANQIVNSKTALALNTTPACIGSNITFAGSPAGGVYSGTGITGANYLASAAGTVQVTYTYTNTDGCISTITTPQVINANPVVNLGTDKSDCEGQTITFDGTTAGVLSYAWTPTGTGAINSVTTAGTYTLSVTDANGCIGSDNVVATFISIPSLSIGPDIDLCPNESATITATVSPSTSVVTWSNKTSGLITTVNAAEVIIATANNGGLCSATDTVNIFMHEIPTVVNMKDTTLCFLDLPSGYLLDAGIATSYSWNTKENTPTITIAKGGSYAVVLSNQYGCQATETVTVLEDCPSSLFVPNAFTPNEDGLNDIFYVKGDNIYDFELYVFNRWGEVIFHSTDMKDGWNGKRNNNMQDAQIDVYVWKVTYKYWKDVHDGGIRREQVGTVSLIK